MSLRPSHLGFWIALAALAVGVLVACSSENSPGSSDGATETAPDSMTPS